MKKLLFISALLLLIGTNLLATTHFFTVNYPGYVSGQPHPLGTHFSNFETINDAVSEVTVLEDSYGITVYPNFVNGVPQVTTFSDPIGLPPCKDLSLRGILSYSTFEPATNYIVIDTGVHNQNYYKGSSAIVVHDGVPDSLSKKEVYISGFTIKRSDYNSLNYEEPAIKVNIRNTTIANCDFMPYPENYKYSIYCETQSVKDYTIYYKVLNCNFDRSCANESPAIFMNDSTLDQTVSYIGTVINNTFTNCGKEIEIKKALQYFINSNYINNSNYTRPRDNAFVSIYAQNTVLSMTHFCYISENVILNTDFGIEASAVNGAFIRNNKIFKSGNGISYSGKGSDFRQNLISLVEKEYQLEPAIQTGVKLSINGGSFHNLTVANLHSSSDNMVGIMLSGYQPSSGVYHHVGGLIIKGFDKAIKHNQFTSLPENIIHSCIYPYTSANSIEGNFTFDGTNITEDPLFNDPANNDFSLKYTATEKSPCIGTGFFDPNQDGIADPYSYGLELQDMGAVPHFGDACHTYNFYAHSGNNSGIKWCSFPVLDTITDTSNPLSATPWLGDEDNIRQMFDAAINEDPIPSELTEIRFQDATNNNHEEIFVYNTLLNRWDHDDQTLNSSKGYKVQVNQDCTLPEVFGTIEINPALQFSEVNQEYWVAYNLPFAQDPLRALTHQLPNLSQVKTQKATFTKYYPPFGAPYWLPKYYKNVPLYTGDMVALTFENPTSKFNWNETPPTRTAFEEIPELQHFSYTEEFDYTPLYIEFDEGETAEEVAVFANGECIGASVITDSIVHVCTYDKNLPVGTELEIVKYPTTRSSGTNQPKVLNQQLNAYQQSNLTSNSAEKFYMVSYRNKPGTSVNQANTKLTAFNSPNPFNPSTKICFNNPQKGKVSVEIYNVKGQKVKTLANKHFESGIHNLYWQGKNNQNQPVASGVYFYKIKTSNQVITNKMLLLK